MTSCAICNIHCFTEVTVKMDALLFCSSLCRFHRRLFSAGRVRKGGSYYDVLGVSRSSSSKDIKASFLALSKKLHPDLNPQMPSSSFAELNEAYSTLSNISARREYDMKLDAELITRAGRYGGAGNHPRRARAASATRYGQGPSASAYTTGAYRDFPNTGSGYSRDPSLRSRNIRLVLYLLAFVLVGNVFHSFRIHFNQKLFDVSADSHSRRLSRVYSQVKEEARRRTVQEQLDQLRRKQADTHAKLQQQSARK